MDNIVVHCFFFDSQCSYLTQKNILTFNKISIITTHRTPIPMAAVGYLDITRGIFFLPDYPGTRTRKITAYVHATFVQLKLTLSVLKSSGFVQQHRIRIESKNEDTILLLNVSWWVVSLHNIILLASDNIKKDIYGNISIKYISSVTRVPDKLPDWVPG